MSFEKKTWSSGNVVEKPYIIVDGVKHEVQPAKVEGGDPITPDELNRIENGIEEARKTANNVVDTFNVEDKITNAPSVNAVENYINTSNSNRALYLGCEYLKQKKSDFNLNDLPEGSCCYYNMNDLPVNYPAKPSYNYNTNYMVYCFRNITDYGSIQLAWSDGNSDGADNYIYIRKRWGNTWTSWKKITTS